MRTTGVQSWASNANAVDAYLSTRMRQFKDAFLPIYSQRLALVRTTDAERTGELAAAEFHIFSQELKRVVDQLPEEIERTFAEPFTVAKTIGIDSELIQLVAGMVRKYAEAVAKEALDLATDTVASPVLKVPMNPDTLS